MSIPYYNKEKAHNTNRLRNWTVYQYIESERNKGNYKIYYIDIDFECGDMETESIYYDIYGPVTEPEICQ